MESFLASLDPLLIYVVVGVLTFGESAAFLGLLFPGEVGLVAAAALGNATGVDPVVLAAVGTVCAFAGGLVGYDLGRRFGPRLMQWPRLAERFGDRWAALRPAMRGRRGAALVVVARFNQVTRAITPALAGSVRMRLGRFAVANAFGALAWTATFTAIGHYAAEFWASASTWVHLGGIAIVVAYVGVVVALRVRRRVSRSRG